MTKIFFTRIFVGLIKLGLIIVFFHPYSVGAAPLLQDPNPEEQCEKGIQLFGEKQYEEAFQHLEAGYSERETIIFNNPDTLGRCAMLLGQIYEENGDVDSAQNMYKVAATNFHKSDNKKYEYSALSKIAYIYRSQELYDDALNYSKQALTIALKSEDLDGQGRSLTSIGFAYHKIGDYDDALASYLQALKIFRGLGDRGSEAIVLNNLGGVYETMSRYNDALDVYQEVLKINSELGREDGPVRNNIGQIYYFQGRFPEAIESFQRALKIFRSNGDLTGEAYALNNIGGVYASLGQFNKALDYHQQSFKIGHELGEKAHDIRMLHNIATVYNAQGRLGDAISYEQQALNISRQVGDLTSQPTILSAIGMSYYELGRNNDALNYLQQSLSITQKLGNSADEARILNGIGLVYASLGDNEKALDYYRQELSISHDIGAPIQESNALGNIGVILFKQKKYNEALTYLEQALEIQRKIGSVGQGTILNNIGRIYIEQGNYNGALGYFEDGLDIQKNMGISIGTGITLSNLGMLYFRQGRLAQASMYYEQAITEFEGVRSIAGSDTVRDDFISNYSEAYNTAAWIAYQENRNQQAFFISERGRARAFLDSISTSYIELSDQVFSDLLTKEQEAFSACQATQHALSNARLLNPPDPELIADLEKQLAEAEKEYEKTSKSINARGDQLAALVPGRSTVLNLEEVQALLPTDTTLVSYYVLGDNGTLVFVITHTSFNTTLLPNATSEKLGGALQAFTNSPDLKTTIHPKALQDLYVWLIEPIKEQLNTPFIGIIPHQELHYVPFAALIDGKTYFGEQHVLFELPSASSLPFIQKNSSHLLNKKVLVLGAPASDVPNLPPLIYAGKEADSVAKLLGGTAYIGVQASEAQLRKSVKGASVIHLAVHGEYDNTNAMYSTLYLTSGNEYDGRLEVHEIYGLDLSFANLVILSACQTQIGKLSKGDELVGLTRAFMFAGAPSIISSLWNVDDEATQVLMMSFYHHWQEEGLTKGQALQAAQADVRGDPRWQSPYYWAGFVLNGSAGIESSSEILEISDLRPNLSLWILVITACTCGLIFFLTVVWFVIVKKLATNKLT